MGQVLIADLVAERCFWEIAQQKVDLSGVLINPVGRLDKIQSEANKLSNTNVINKFTYGWGGGNVNV